MSTRRLGRGLSALIPGAPAEGQSGTQGDTLPLRAIRPSSTQPRTVFNQDKIKELAASIEANGLIQPIVVRATGAGDYVIIAGERRYRAAKLLGLHEIPAVVRDVADGQAFELALIENVQREDLDPIEEANAYRHLVENYELTQQQVAERVGKDRVTIANAIRLLKLPLGLQTEISSGALSAGHARAILMAPEHLRSQLGHDAIQNGWSVRETERQARGQREEQPEPPDEAQTAADPGLSPAETPAQSSAAIAVEDQLRGALGAPVRLVERGGKGRIEVRFHSYEELERLIELITGLDG